MERAPHSGPRSSIWSRRLCADLPGAIQDRVDLQYAGWQRVVEDGVYAQGAGRRDLLYRIGRQVHLVGLLSDEVLGGGIDTPDVDGAKKDVAVLVELYGAGRAIVVDVLAVAHGLQGGGDPLGRRAHFSARRVPHVPQGVADGSGIDGAGLLCCQGDDHYRVVGLARERHLEYGAVLDRVEVVELLGEVGWRQRSWSGTLHTLEVLPPQVCEHLVVLGAVHEHELVDDVRLLQRLLQVDLRLPHRVADGHQRLGAAGHALVKLRQVSRGRRLVSVGHLRRDFASVGGGEVLAQPQAVGVVDVHGADLRVPQVLHQLGQDL